MTPVVAGRPPVLVSLRLTIETQFLQIGSNCHVELGGFRLLQAKPCSKLVHLPLERLVVFLCCFGADIAARRQHVVMATDFVECSGPAEAGYVGVLARIFVTAPSVVCVGDLCVFRIAQLSMYAVYERAHLPCIDKQRFAPPIPEPTVPLVAR